MSTVEIGRHARGERLADDLAVQADALQRATAEAKASVVGLSIRE
jgi:hypothetical protein